MATIVRDPLVDDQIVEIEMKSENDSAAVRQLYEEGKLVLLKGVRFDIDFAFLDSLDFDVDGPPEILRKLKKYGGEKIVAIDPSSSDPVGQFLFREIFAGDAGKLSYFQEQVAIGNSNADLLYAKIFPRYVNTRVVHTWRFTSTKFENLHWDNFAIPEIFQQVRIFTNIASSPRLWRTSHAIDDFASSIYAERNLEQFADRSGDALNFFVNNEVLGGMKRPCLDRLPKHHIAFDQGDVWLCETRIVAHQIYHGEKAFAGMYFSDPQSMDRPALSFDERIRRLHEHQSSAASVQPSSALAS